MTIYAKQKQVLLPGDVIAEGEEYRVGTGVIKDGTTYRSTVVGMFTGSGKQLSVRAFNSRYIPKVGDLVIGKIIDVSLTSWRVDIRAPYDGLLLGSNAVRRRIDPVKEDIRKIFDIGDAIKAKIISFDRTKDPSLSTKESDLGKLKEGRIVEISPSRVSRIIGKKGNMISTIRKLTRTNIIIGQNGRIWLKGEDRAHELLAIDAIRKIDMEAHTSGLTDKIKEFLTEQLKEV